MASRCGGFRVTGAGRAWGTGPAGTVRRTGGPTIDVAEGSTGGTRSSCHISEPDAAGHVVSPSELLPQTPLPVHLEWAAWISTPIMPVGRPIPWGDDNSSVL